MEGEQAKSPVADLRSTMGVQLRVGLVALRCREMGHTDCGTVLLEEVEHRGLVGASARRWEEGLCLAAEEDCRLTEAPVPGYNGS